MDISAIDSVTTEFSYSTRLYRYISVDSLKYFFDHSFSLTRVSTWPDRMELADFAFLQPIPNLNSHGSLKDIFASCWTLDSIPQNSLELGHSTTLANEELKQDGSASMWEDYCKTGGVRVATTLGKLLGLFESVSLPDTTIYYGKVRYLAAKDSARFNGVTTIEQTLFHKRVGFRHEAEFRFVGSIPNQDSNHFPVPINDYYDLLDEVLVFPLKNPAQNSDAAKLHDMGVQIATGPNIGTNNKNGRPFCRISQLYGIVSETIGEVAYQKWEA